MEIFGTKSRHFGGSKAVSGVRWALRIGKAGAAVPQSRYSLRHTGPVHYVRIHLPLLPRKLHEIIELSDIRCDGEKRAE